MGEEEARYCDVALPVPIDRLFTYEIPPALRSRAQVGARVWVPFGSRHLNGVILRLRSETPAPETRLLEKLLDDEPVLDEKLLSLGKWIAEYYCSPVGEVYKGMLPLGGEVRQSKTYSLTTTGQEIARQLTVALDPDPASTVITLLAERSRSAEYLSTKTRQARNALRTLVKKGWVTAEDIQESRDILRSPAERLEVEFLRRPDEGVRISKSERELLAYLELHPGSHNLAAVAESVKRASEAARSLARKELVKLGAEELEIATGYERPRPTLNAHQREALAQIEGALGEGKFRTFLMQGVTGSGKTEVYLHAIEAALTMGKSALLMVPEIALTPAVAGQFFHRFGKQVAILHSAFGGAQRADQWRRIRNGNARVIVGTRSAVFAPIQNLGLVIVDEEHDGSYKQGESPRYHGRDVALVRAKEENAVTVLGSATPSVESRFNADRGKYVLLLLPERIARRPMPEVEVIDMRVEFLETKRQGTFSRRLLGEMERRLLAGEQTMLLLNRRGFSSFMLCRACGERLLCSNCSVVLTHHRRDRRMLCHYCGYSEKIPVQCPHCESEYIQFLGTGSERVEDELHTHLPAARIARLDRDSASEKGAFEQILSAFRDGDIDILVGTQMIAKGHDIPNVTLVGVVLADIGLSMPDFRAAERSFQLMTQAAGRAGRGDIPGRVLIQTLNPDHYAVRFAAKQDYDGFYKKETEFRNWLRYPPFSAFANVLIRAGQQEEALRLAMQLGHVLMPAPEGVRVMGPAEAPVVRVRNEYRYQILIKAAKRSVLRGILNDLRAFAEAQRWAATALVIDVDPISLM